MLQKVEPRVLSDWFGFFLNIIIITSSPFPPFSGFLRCLDEKNKVKQTNKIQFNLPFINSPAVLFPSSLCAFTLSFLLLSLSFFLSFPLFPNRH